MIIRRHLNFSEEENVMRRLIAGIAVIMVLALTSCATPMGSRIAMLNRITKTERQRVDERSEQIVDAINNKDRDALKSLYSKKALEEAEDFNGGMDMFFDFIEGDIVSWEIVFGVDTSESVSYGKKTTMYRYDIKIETDIDSYRVFVIDYYVDTIEPDNEGLYMLQIRTSDYKGILGGWQERMRPGFYIPELVSE